MLYLGYFIIVNGQNIKKKSLSEFSIFYLERGEQQFVCTPNATEPPANNNFEAFGALMARARWAQQPLRGSPWVLKYPYCHQIITQTHSKGNRKVSGKSRNLN